MGIYGTYAHKLMESQNEPIYICEFNLNETLYNIKLSIKRFLYNLLNKIERWLNKRKDTKLRNILLKLVTKCKDLINKNNSCEDKSEFEKLSKEAQDLGQEFNEAIFVERYIYDDGKYQTVKRFKVAQDIADQILNKRDIYKLFSDPRFDHIGMGDFERFKNWKDQFEENHPKNTWNKDTIQIILNASVAEIFNKEYCEYLYDASKYVNGIIVNKHHSLMDESQSLQEGIVDAFKSIIESIKKGIVNLIDKINGWLDKHPDSKVAMGLKSILTKLKNLLTKADKIKSKEDAEEIKEEVDKNKEEAEDLMKKSNPETNKSKEDAEEVKDKEKQKSEEKEDYSNTMNTYSFNTFSLYKYALSKKVQDRLSNFKINTKEDMLKVMTDLDDCLAIYNFTKHHVIEEDFDSKDITTLKEISYRMMFSGYHKSISAIEPSKGDKFDSDIHSILGTRTDGIVSKVKLKGIIKNGKVIQKALIDVE